MPLIDDFAHEFIKCLDLNEFGSRITINNIPLGKVKDIKRLLEVDSGFRHYFRSFYLPVLMFDTRVHDHDYECWRLHEVAPEEGGWDNFLTSDNPIIVEDIEKIFSFNTKLIFPLSKKHLVTFSPSCSNGCELSAMFTTKLAMAMNSQSEKYLVGSNREYIEKVLKLQEEVYGSEGVPRLRSELFRCL